MNRIFNKSVLNSTNIFFVDGLGACLTALLLFTIMRNFSGQIGMPKPALAFLSATASLFCIYSFCCFFLVKKNGEHFLRAIIVANLIYGFLTLGFVLYNFEHLTILGITYFTIETVVLFTLVFFEIRLLKNPT